MVISFISLLCIFKDLQVKWLEILDEMELKMLQVKSMSLIYGL